MIGKMIVLDGSNGAGKSSVMKAVKEYFEKSNIKHVTTREPGGTPISESIREIILDKSHSEMTDITELMLFAAARAQHLKEKIIPSLNNGIHVLSDRFESATVAFQQYGRGAPAKTINTLNDLSLGEFRPDMTIILDLDPQKGLDRVKSRGDDFDRMETIEDMDFLHRARNGYLQQAKDHPERFFVVDAENSLDVVIEQVLSCIKGVI
jgi:dTMP kinase